MIYRGIDFNGSYLTSGDCKLWCTFNNAFGGSLFLAERQLVCLEYAGEQDPYIGVESDNPIATYSRDSNNRVIIDLSEWVRMQHAAGESVNISVFCPEDDDIFSLFDSVANYYLCNPESMIIPRIDGMTDYISIILPNRLLSNDLIDPVGCSFIWPSKGAPSRQWKYRAIGASSWTNIDFGTPFFIGAVGVELNSQDGTYRFVPEPTNCGVRYIMLRWQSSLGTYKMHTFEIYGQKIETGSDYSLLMQDNSYNTIKGREDSLSVKLDKLTTYDIWYYSDIITSSDVQLITCDGVFLGQISSGQIIGTTKLEVVTKNVTAPSGDNANGKIEFEIKVKRYDAVSL